MKNIMNKSLAAVHTHTHTGESNGLKNFEKEHKIKNYYGITLIALVITIVVLIILAGVIISITLGNGGIIDRAKTAKEQYQNATEQEQTDVAKMTNEIDKNVNGNRETATLTEQTVTNMLNNLLVTRKYSKSISVNANTYYFDGGINVDDIEGYTPIGVVGFYTNNNYLVYCRCELINNNKIAILIQNVSSSTAGGEIGYSVLYQKNF